MIPVLLPLFLALAPAVPAASAPVGGLEPARLQALLQRFADRLYLKAFRHLGDERDFDHGHILFDAAGRPVAILYHTQELAKDEPAGGRFAYVDPAARNWIQWIDGDRIENADRYVRSAYPSTASWRWFVERRLPVFRRYRTVVDKMLDAKRVGAGESKSLQWVFTRVDCAARPPDASIGVRLPTGETVCLALSAS